MSLGLHYSPDSRSKNSPLPVIPKCKISHKSSINPEAKIRKQKSPQKKTQAFRPNTRQGLTRNIFMGNKGEFLNLIEYSFDPPSLDMAYMQQLVFRPTYSRISTNLNRTISPAHRNLSL